jgi:hypothetical protein
MHYNFMHVFVETSVSKYAFSDASMATAVVFTSLLSASVTSYCYIIILPNSSLGRGESGSMIVTLAWAVGETKAPGAGPRYT